MALDAEQMTAQSQESSQAPQTAAAEQPQAQPQLHEQLMAKLNELRDEMRKEVGRVQDGWKSVAESAYQVVRNLHDYLYSLSSEPQETRQEEPQIPEEWDPFDETHRKALARHLRQVSEMRSDYQRRLAELLKEISELKARDEFLVRTVIPAAQTVPVALMYQYLGLAQEDPDVLQPQNFEKLVRALADQQMLDLRKAYETVFGEKLKKKEEERIRRELREQVRAELLGGTVTTGVPRGPSRYQMPNAEALQDMIRKLQTER